MTDDLTKRLDDLTCVSETATVDNIVDYQSTHLAYFQQAYGRFMSQFKMYFSAIVDTGNNINYLDKSHWPKHRALQFIIATHALKQFYSAYTLLLDGAYEDAIALQRSIYESFLRILFISMYPEDSYNAYDYKVGKKQTGIKFNATNLVKDLGLDWSTYDIMSKFAHSNMYRVVETGASVANGQQKEAIVLIYEKDDDMISVVVNFMLFLLVIFLHLFSETFTVNYSPAEKDVKKHLDIIREYANISLEVLKNHDVSKYWQQVGNDVDDIFKLIATLDSSKTPNWRTEWVRIRGK